MRKIGAIAQTLAFTFFLATSSSYTQAQYGDAFSAAGRDARAASAVGRDTRAATRETTAASRETRAASETKVARANHTENKPRSSSAHVPNSENRWVEGSGSASRSAPKPHEPPGSTVSASRDVRRAESAAAKSTVERSASEGKAGALAKTENPSRIAWKEESGELRAQKRVASYEGHGNDRHGPGTTLKQQEARLDTGVAPDGKFSPTDRATKFDSNKAHVEAVERARTEVNKTNPPTHTANGKPENAEVIVGGRKDGYGSGLEKTPAGNVPTGQDQSAAVRFRWNDQTGKWEERTAFPTNKAPTTR